MEVNVEPWVHSLIFFNLENKVTIQFKKQETEETQ